MQFHLKLLTLLPKMLTASPCGSSVGNLFGTYFLYNFDFNIRTVYYLIRIVSACSDTGIEIKYLMEWPNNVIKVVTSTEAKALYPKVVVEYLESKIEFMRDAPILYENMNFRGKNDIL